MKRRAGRVAHARLRAIEAGERVVVGVNPFTESEPSPLVHGRGSILKVDDSAEREQIERLRLPHQAQREPR